MEDLPKEVTDAALVTSEYLIFEHFDVTRDLMAAFILTRLLSEKDQLEYFEEIRLRIDAVMQEGHEGGFAETNGYSFSASTLLAVTLVVVGLSAVGVSTLVGWL